jgi:hypothetical protein
VIVTGVPKNAEHEKVSSANPEMVNLRDFAGFNAQQLAAYPSQHGTM